MWKESSILEFTLHGAVFVLISFCVLFLFLVFWKRSRQTCAERSTNDVRNELRRWSAGLLFLGLLGITFAYLMRKAVALEGAWRGERAVSAHARIQAHYGEVDPDGLMVQTASKPQDDREELELKHSRLEAQCRALAAQPLAFASGLVQNQQRALAAEHDRRAALDRFLNDLIAPQRDPFDQMFKHQEIIIQLRGDIAGTDKAIRKAQEKLLTVNNQLAHERSLTIRPPSAELLLQKLSHEAQQFGSEIAKLRNQATSLQAEIQQNEEALAQLQTLAYRQNNDLALKMDRLRIAVLSAVDDVQRCRQALEAEKELALHQREKELSQLDWSICRIAAVIDAKKRREQVPEPLHGWVVYRDASTGLNAERGTLSGPNPDKTFRFRAKVPLARVDWLRQAGEVTLEVGDGEFLRQFPGRFAGSFQIDTEPANAIVEMECQPPVEVMEAVTENNKVRAKYIWQPPLLSLWPFTVGVILVLAGLFGCILCFFFGGSVHEESSRRAREKLVPVPLRMLPKPIAVSATETLIGSGSPGPNATADTIVAERTKGDLKSYPSGSHPAFAEAASACEFVEQLAIELREAIINERILQDTVTSAESMLDHRHPRTIRIFRSIFRQDRSYLTHLDALPRFTDGKKSSLYSRVTRILELVGAGPKQLELFPDVTHPASQALAMKKAS